MTDAAFNWGDLACVIGDNAASGKHRAGYNGIYRLTHRSEPSSLFVPFYAGMNLEHIFDGHRHEGRDMVFEPRRSPMHFTRINEHEALLHQPPTPFHGMESWTRFTLRKPHYVDFQFTCCPRRAAFPHGYIGLFWASYINAPSNKSVYFRGKYNEESPVQWLQYGAQWHHDQSTVLHVSDQTRLKFSRNFPDALFKSFSPLRFETPFYYGRFGRCVFLLMFDRAKNIRFSHSPSGGGHTGDHQDTCPAWDFQFIIPRFKVNAKYGFKARLVYKPWKDRDDVLREYGRWRKLQDCAIHGPGDQ